MLDAHLFFAGGVMLLTFVTVSFGGGVGAVNPVDNWKRPPGGRVSLQVSRVIWETVGGSREFRYPLTSESGVKSEAPVQTTVREFA